MITNEQNLPLPLAMGLLYSDYDGVTKHKNISTTTVLKPVRQLALAERFKPQPLDVADLGNAVLGTAFHNSMENVWNQNPKVLGSLMKALGLSEKTAERIIINPTGKTSEEDIPLYIEQRKFRKFKGWTIHGKYDFIWMNEIYDYKVTGVFSWKKSLKDKKNDYIKQLAINKWLNPDLKIGDVGHIVFFFKDWKQYEYARSTEEKPYPKSQLLVESYDLSKFDVEKYLKKKLKKLEKTVGIEEHLLPECNGEDRWAQAPKYKFYTKPDSTRAYRTAEDPNDLQQWIGKFPAGRIETDCDLYVRCRKYCAYSNNCQQFQKVLIKEKGEA